MTDRELLELAERAGFARDSFANADCSCEECNWARDPLRKFAALVRREALEEAARRCEALQREHDRYCAAMGFGYADGITGRECARDIRALAAQEADK